MVERVESGIKGFDKLVNGGIPKNSLVIVKGGPGTGKTTFCLQFLVKGIENGEKCVMLTTEEGNGKLFRIAKNFGWELEKWKKEKKLAILSYDGENIRKILNELKRVVKSTKASRVVIDSLSTISVYATAYVNIGELSIKDVIDETTVFSSPIIGDEIRRRSMHRIMRELERLDATILMTSEDLDYDKISDFLCDGLIKLDMEAISSALQRTLRVVKMRGTNMDGSVRDMEITNKGIVVY